MIGQLLSTLNSPRRSSSQRSNVDSATEDLHTQSLLFPDSTAAPVDEHDGAPALSPGLGDMSHSAVRSSWLSDYACASESLDLEAPRDIRILVAQGGTVGLAELLFDSKPSTAESPRMPSHSRASSRTESTLPRARTAGVPSIPEDRHRRTSSSHSAAALGAFQRSKIRRGSISSVQSFDEAAVAAQQQQQESSGEDIAKVALTCMFENMTSSYKGTSNKVHIIPLQSKPYDSSICSSTSLGDFSSLSRMAASAGTTTVRRPSSLSRSHVPGESLLDEETMRFRGHDGSSSSGRRVVLVTRTFSVQWADDEEEERSKEVKKDAKAQMPPRSSKVFRSPMYAITVALHLPIAPSDASPPVSRTGTFGKRSLRKDSTSRLSHASLGSSADSEKRLASLFVPESDLAQSWSMNSDVDEKVDLIGRHWDIISRTLTTLQTLVQGKISSLLKPLSKLRRGLRLHRMALASDEEIRRAAEESGQRIVRGMKIPRVQTGHGRWDSWREEAAWVVRWQRDGTEGDFLAALMTAFLGTHTTWAHSLAPKSYRRKWRDLQRVHGSYYSSSSASPGEGNSNNEVALATRTVVISKDKMAARRIVFLLAAFLAANSQHGQQLRYHHHGVKGDASPLRPSTAASCRAYSQSPPKMVVGGSGVHRQESLRKTINRRNKPTTRGAIVKGGKGVGSTFVDPLEDRTVTGGGPDIRGFISSKLSMTEIDPSGQKAASTLSTGSVHVKPLFARQPSFTHAASVPGHHSRNSSDASIRLNSGGSGRGNSSESQWSGRWGSFKNLWSGAGRRSTTEDGYDDLVRQTTDEGLGVVVGRDTRERSKLQRMVDEVESLALVEPPATPTIGAAGDDAAVGVFPSPELHSAELRNASLDPEAGFAHARKPSQPIDVPLKMSVNKDDGVIDVEIPFLDYGSPGASPALLVGGGEQSGSSFGASSSFGGVTAATTAAPSLVTLAAREPERPRTNVGGWLDRLHPDFAVQAVRPYLSVIDDVRKAMSAEPNPSPSSGAIAEENEGNVERWLDVCTTVVADADACTVKRIRLRRLVRYVRKENQPAIVTPGIHGLPGAPKPSQYGNPYEKHSAKGGTVVEVLVREEWDESSVEIVEALLADAVEKVVDGPSSLRPATATAIGSSGTTPATTESSTGKTSPRKEGAQTGTTSPSKLHTSSKGPSSTSSRSSSYRGRRPGESQQEEADTRSRECQALIVGALEGVVASLVRERQQSVGASASGAVEALQYVAGVSGASDEESMLREGVRKWLDDVDARSAAIGAATEGMNAAVLATAGGVIEEALNEMEGEPTPLVGIDGLGGGKGSVENGKKLIGSGG